MYHLPYTMAVFDKGIVSFIYTKKPFLKKETITCHSKKLRL